MRARDQTKQIPASLDELLRQIWGGHQCIDENMPLSILQETIRDSETLVFRKMVTSLPALANWGSLLAARTFRYKDSERRLQGVDWVEKIEELLHALPVLKNTIYDVDGKTFSLGPDRVRAFPFVHFSSEIDNPMFFYRFEGLSSLQARLFFEDPYSDYEEEYPLVADPAAREYLEQMRIVLGVQRVPEALVQLFGSGYDHLKNVAYAIAYTESRTAKLALEKSKKDHPEIYEEVASYDEGGRKTLVDENFAVLLLAEQGPSRVISKILESFGSVEKDYLEYLQVKRSAKDSAAEWEQRTKAVIARRSRSIEKHLALDNEMKQRVTNQIEIDAKTWAVLSAAGMELDAPQKYVESIGMRIAMLRSWLGKLQQSASFKADAVINANKLIERTYRFLTCFYGGLCAYHEDAKQNPGDVERNEAALVQKVSEILKAIETYSAGQLKAAFVEAAKQASMEASDRVLGRKTVCNMAIHDRLTSKGVFDVINEVKHDKGVVCSRQEAIEFLERTVQLFEFFRTNEDSSIGSPGYSLTPVYPSLITFREANRKRDGLLVYHYEVNSMKDELNKNDICVLTPLHFSSYDEYYCIPVFNRSTRRWWREPFLLKTASMAPLFDEEEPAG